LNSGIGAWLLVRSLGIAGLLLLLANAAWPGIRPALPFAVFFAVVVSLLTAALASRWVARRAEDLASAADKRVNRALASAHDELTEERDRLRGILAGMEEGVLLLDEQGHVALLNSALREMLLLGADSVGKTLLEAIRHAQLK